MNATIEHVAKTLLVAAILGMLKLAFQVNTLSAEKKALEERVDKLEAHETYLHGRVNP